MASNWRPLSRRQGCVFLLLLALGLAVRCHDLGKYPRPFETFDEYHYLWVGLSLMDTGHATAWSTLTSYGKCGVKAKEVFLRDGRKFALVTPAMDHPPLFSLAAGAFSRLFASARLAQVMQPNGATRPIWEVDLRSARRLSVILFAFSFFLLFEIARRAFSFPTACLAALFYGLVDHVVFHSRLLVTENLSTPCFLLGLFALQAYVSGRWSRPAFGVVTILSCAAALLCKVIAVSQVAAIVFLLVLCRRWRDSVFPVIGALLGIALYAAYGWWQDWTVFRAVLAGQSGRFCGFNAILPIITAPSIVHSPDTNMVLLAGWVALFALVAFHRHARVLVAAVVYLLAFAYFTSVSAIYGWHIVPFYPFLCVALAALIARVYRRHRPMEVAALMVLLLPAIFDGFGSDIHAPWVAWALRVAYCLAVVFVLLMPLCGPRHVRRVTRLAVIAATVLLLAQQGWSSWTHEAYQSRQSQIVSALTR